MVSTDFDALFATMFTPRKIARAQTVQPPWGESGRLATPAGDLAYWRSGAGPAVLLVHGWEGIHSDLDAFVEPLVARGYSIVSFDHYAHGESARETTTLFEFRDGVRAMAERFGPFAGIVAHSVGGPATAMALQAGTAAQRVALIASPTRYEDFVCMFASIVGIPHETLVAELRARDFALDELDLPKIAATLNVPVLLTHSRDDRVTAFEGSERIARAWRGSRFVPTDGLGHNRILRDPATIATIVDFVAN